MAELRRTTGSMLLLTVFGGLLMLPPLVFVFDQPISHFGIPQIVLYLFAVWLLLVIGTGLLAHALPRDASDAKPGEGER